MPKFEVEIGGAFMDALEKGELSIVGNIAFKTVEAPNADEAISRVEDWLYDEGLSVGFVDEIKETEVLLELDTEFNHEVSEDE